mmetsp:Transcript_39307/g.83783  ORF Transcript_39307/g.83783 Transcript_39307/m.83783 type:complete len:224 (+) Transcript_39307:536-1207(+)
MLPRGQLVGVRLLPLGRWLSCAHETRVQGCVVLASREGGQEGLLPPRRVEGVEPVRHQVGLPPSCSLRPPRSPLSGEAPLHGEQDVLRPLGVERVLGVPRQRNAHASPQSARTPYLPDQVPQRGDVDLLLHRSLEPVGPLRRGQEVAFASRCRRRALLVAARQHRARDLLHHRQVAGVGQVRQRFEDAHKGRPRRCPVQEPVPGRPDAALWYRGAVQQCWCIS